MYIEFGGMIMARKKKNEAPVVLSREELIPSVIGIIDDKEKSNWTVLALFAFLILFVFFLPMITSYFSGEEQFVNPPSENVKPSQEENPINETEFYPLTSNLIIQDNGLTFQNFLLENNTINLTVTNDSNAKDYLETHLYYLELYDENKTLLQRIKLPNEFISKGTSQTYTFDLTTTSSIKQIVIEEKKSKDYPLINLKKEKDGTYSLSCSKEKEKIDYKFDKNQKLNFLTDTVNYSNRDNTYHENLVEYRQLASKYNAIEGVTSNIMEVSNGFTFTTTIDLEIVDLSNSNIQNILENVAYYKKDTEGKVVYFELSAMNYKCSI